MDSHPPVPTPRARVTKKEQQHNQDNLKRPIPLPRARNNVEHMYSNPDEPPKPKSPSPSELLKTLGTTSRQLTESLSGKMAGYGKSMVDNTMEKFGKSKTKLEQSTKNASLHVKTLKKRITTSFGKDQNVTVYSVPAEDNSRPQTLPPTADNVDIFSGIQFHSPLSKNHEDLSNIRDSVIDNKINFRNYSPPPPIYPPPPLPDESLYEEPNSASISVVHSEISNVSSQSLSLSNLSLRTDLSDPEPNINELSTLPLDQARRTTSRCISWSFYDSVSKCSSISTEPIYSNDLNDPIDPIYANEDSVIDHLYGNITSNSVNLNLRNATPPRTPEGSQNVTPTDTPTPPERLSKVSVQNSLYENWDLECFERRAQNNSSIRHTPSVIREFDPLSKKTDVKSTSPTQNELNLIETMLEGDTYGTLRGQENSDRYLGFDDESVYDSDEDNTKVSSTFYLPTPPERVDSLALEENSTTDSDKPCNTQVYANSVLPSGTYPSYVYTDPIEPTKPALPQKNRIRGGAGPPTYEESIQKPGSTSANNFPLAPKINLSSSQYESLAETMSNYNFLNNDNNHNNPNINNNAHKERISVMNRFSNALKQLPDTAMNLKRTKSVRKPKTSGISRPTLNASPPLYKGKLYKLSDEIFNAKQDNPQPRWCKLKDKQFSCYSDNAMTTVKELFPLESVMSVQIVLNHKVSLENNDLHCFELNIQGGVAGVTRSIRNSQLFALETSISRNQWAQKILESLTNVFPPTYTVDFSRAGWCYLKDNISAKWTGTWIMLRKRTLIYYSISNDKLQKVDLRKARCIVLQEADESCDELYCDKGPLALVDTPYQTLYLCMGNARETKVWRHEIRATAIKNGAALNQQQLTRDDIPTLVDKCVNFIYAHGSMSQGIYRRNGSQSAMSRLLNMFRTDAWKVQLSASDFTEHDVAGTLKWFFRDLPEPLLTNTLGPRFLAVAAKKSSDKLIEYQQLIQMLPLVNSATLRKLLGHLKFIQSQADKNLMNSENLAAVWGPTILHAQKPHEDTSKDDFSKYENRVVHDLIQLYGQLYQQTEDEQSKEKLMLSVLLRYHSSAKSIAPSKPSGDIRMWIQLDNADKDCVNVTITPQMTSADLCYELSAKMGVESHLLTLEESVLQGQLTRPMHFSESILQTVLRWGYWNDEDRKDNTLVLKKDTFFKELAPIARSPCTMNGELKFADAKSKHFKNHVFEFKQAKLSYYKDKGATSRICEWRIEDIVWYLGHETKRNPQSRWAITFIPRKDKPKRSREASYFGCTVAGNDCRERLKWLGVMLCAEYPDGLLPHARLVF